MGHNRLDTTQESPTDGGLPRREPTRFTAEAAQNLRAPRRGLVPPQQMLKTRRYKETIPEVGLEHKRHEWGKKHPNTQLETQGYE